MSEPIIVEVTCLELCEFNKENQTKLTLKKLLAANIPAICLDNKHIYNNGKGGTLTTKFDSEKDAFIYTYYPKGIDHA